MSFDTLQRLIDRIIAGSAHPWEFLVELILIAISVNWCASVLQGTRGTRLLRGLLILLVGVTLIVQVMTTQLGWTRLELLYRYFVSGLAFIALVAFQPELRRALLRAGDVRFLRRSSPVETLIPALVEAFARLSRARHGALLAIQREVGLANWTENGVELNAEISADLLTSIFFPNSPLHDLGVVVRGSKVLAASCQFPMAESGEVDPSLGSRHRAAVGLSQESDALVVVASEETGRISLADQGELIRCDSLVQLENELRQRLNHLPATTRGMFPMRTLTDFKRMIRRGSIVIPLTLLIWFLADQASLKRADGVSVALSTIAPVGLVVDLEPAPPAIFRIAVRGSTRDVDALRLDSAAEPLRVGWTIQTRYASPGTYRISGAELIEMLGSLPEIRARGVAVDSVTPDSMTLVVDEIASLVVPVQVDGGSVRVGEVRVDPPEATVFARKADLARTAGGAPRALVVRPGERLTRTPPNQTADLTNVPLELRLGDIPLLRAEPNAVNVSLRVMAETATAKLRKIPVQLAASPLLLQRVDVQPIDANEWVIEIEVEGDRALVETLKSSDVQATVPLSSDSDVDETRAFEVVVRLPPGVRMIGPPKQVQLKLVARDAAPP